jgi:ferredoxin-type protein NapH
MASREKRPVARPLPRWVLPLIQSAFLGLFITLHLVGSTRIWLFVLIAGFIASPFFGRIYCRMACPVNACNRLFAFLPRGLWPRRGNAPAWLGHPLVRAAWYAILLAAFVAAMVLRARFHLFTIITVIGIILCSAFPVAVWCGGLCPWGVLFQCGSRIPKPRWIIAGGASRSPSCWLLPSSWRYRSPWCFSPAS